MICSLSPQQIARKGKGMAFMLRKVSLASMLYVMLYLAAYCDAVENKTAKQPPYVMVCHLRHR